MYRVYGVVQQYTLYLRRHPWRRTLGLGQVEREMEALEVREVSHESARVGSLPVRHQAEPAKQRGRCYVVPLQAEPCV